MQRALLLSFWIVLALGACTRHSAQLALAASASARPNPTAGAGTAASSESSAQSAEETNSDSASDEPGSASLERLAALPAEQQLPASHWKPGVNYDVISPTKPVSVAPGKIEVMEVFWLACPHCYALEPSVLAWLKSKPDYVSFVRVPVMWGPVHRAHARLFYTLEQLGRNDLVEKAFDEIHQYALGAQGQQGNLERQHSFLVGQTDDATFQEQLDFAKANGVDPETFRKAYNSAAVNADLQHAQEITDRYMVTGVPFVVIDGKYSTDVGKAGGSTELFELIDSLAAAEHRRPHGNG
jgi:protein dithiol oxidoreductase (disulfide-forming)